MTAPDASDPQIPYRFDRTHSCEELQGAHAELPPQSETDVEVAVAGRLMLRREMGKLTFGTLQDSSGRIQLFARAADTPDYKAFQSLSIGDWVGVRGTIMTTKTGEISVKVASWVTLARTQRSFPDTWHGITDPDMRYRQRYVDLWVSEESRRTLQLRSRAVMLLRRFLDDRGFIEVETPVFHPIPGGALAKPFTTHHNALDMELYLRIATELYLKRMVVGGFEKVFEVGRTFRNEGLSPRHNPEFTMLEVYEAYADYGDMMALTEQLVAHLSEELHGTTKLTYGGRDLDLTPPWRRATLSELVKEHAGLDVHVDMDRDELVAIAAGVGVVAKDGWGPGKLVLEIYEKTTESQLWGPVFVMDYPKEVSPLARDHRDTPDLVERFEAIVAGRELANAFSELCDADEQRRRFEDQAKQKADGDDEAMVVDHDFIRALEYGMPPTGGLGVGIDRLVMLLADVDTIRDVLPFPTLRPEQFRD